MTWTQKDIAFMLIIIGLAIGWAMAVFGQINAVNNIKESYNHLVNECNRIIGVQDKKDFCINLPNGNQTCHQNDLNILQSFG